MTDKEQIIIHGVNITGCICCLRICTTTKKPEAICNEYGYCSKVPNCYFKQLARYFKALEEIEEFCNLRKLNPVYALVTIKILDIINKVKGDIND